MARFLGRRLLSSLLTLVIFSAVVFFLASALMPGDFTTNFLPGNAEFREQLGERLGLDRPIWQQYLIFMGSLLTGDFGTSFSGVPIGPTMAALLPWTLLIFTVAVGTAFVVGLGLGRIAGWSNRRWLRGSIRFAAVTTHSLFPPFLTFFLTWLFIQVFGISSLRFIQGLEVASASEIPIALPRNLINVPDLGATPWVLMASFGVMAVAVAGVAWAFRRLARRRLWTAASAAVYLAGLWWLWDVVGIRSDAVQIMIWLALPIIVVAILAFGEIALVIDASMDGAAEEDYIRTARAKGLREVDVRNRHAARLAILPALSKFVVSLPFVLTGLVIVEFAFTVPSSYQASLFYPGISRMLFGGLDARDYPLVVGGLLVIGAISVVARLAIDLIHARLDPRLLVDDRVQAVEL
ncbi:MAG: ABC transporter permease [Acidimicrobiia bacterium]